MDPHWAINLKGSDMRGHISHTEAGKLKEAMIFPEVTSQICLKPQYLLVNPSTQKRQTSENLSLM